MFLFGSVVQTVSAESVLVNLENRNQISFGNATRTNNVQREERNSNRNDKIARMQERRNQAKSPTSQPGTNKTEINNENSNNYNISASGDVVIGTMNKDSHNDNSVNINNSKNDNRVYDKSINNSEIDNSKNKGATINSQNTKDSHNTTNSHNVNVTKNGSGQTHANSAGAVNVKRNSNTNRQAEQNTARAQNASFGNNNGSKQNDAVKSNTATQQNTSVKNNTNLNTSSNVQVNTPKKNANPRQQQNNKNFGNGGNVRNTNTAQKMQQNNRTTVNNKNTNNYNIKSGGDVVIGEMNKDSHDNNSINIDNSRNDNRVYDSSINNSKIDNSKNKGATINSHNTENSHNITNSGNVNIEIKETIKENINHDPQGKLDSVQYKGVNQIYVKGWAYDEDDMNSPVTVEFRVSSASGVLLSKATANKFYSNEIKNHGFEETYTVNLVNNYYGWQTIYAIAKNVGNIGKDQKIGEGRINIVIPSPSGSATISDPDTLRRIKITGWTNTERVEYIVAGTTRTININNPGYTTKNFEEYYTLPQEINGQIQVQVYAVDTTNHYAKKSIGNRSILMIKIPKPDGAANISYEQKDRKMKISGWTNTEHVEYVVAGTTRAISINNPNHIRQNFADTYVLPNGIKGTQTADVYAIDTTNTYTKKKIGENSFNVTPTLNGSIQSITSPTTKTVRVIGKTNAPRIIIAVGNITKQEFDLANPNYEDKNFDKSISLSNDIIGKLEVIVNGNDPVEGRVLFIGKGMVEKNYDPEGNVDKINVDGYNKIWFGGQASDKDDLNVPVKLILYTSNGFKSNPFTTTNGRFYEGFELQVPEGETAELKFSIEVQNIGGGKNIFILKDWPYNFKSPIKPVHEVRIARENNADGIPAKQFVDIYKENERDGTYFAKYYDCAYTYEKMPKNVEQKEAWIRKESVEDFACLKGISINRQTVYPNADFTVNTGSTPLKTTTNKNEVVFKGDTQAIIARNDTYGTFLIRYYSRKDDYIRKDRWDTQSNYPNVKKMIPNGLWIDLDNLKYND